MVLKFFHFFELLTIVILILNFLLASMKFISNSENPSCKPLHRL
jgi:hypothetical protein